MNQSQTKQATDSGAVITTTASRVSCNGGGGALGHPQIWLTLGEDDKVTCPYCSATFVKAASK